MNNKELITLAALIIFMAAFSFIGYYIADYYLRTLI